MVSPSGHNITCYGYSYSQGDGVNFTDNSKCPNSDSCCGTTDTCLQNRLCKKASGVLVRPSCANSPWTLNTCAQICLYGQYILLLVHEEHKVDISQDNKDGFVPRVNICPDNSHCCDEDTDCCAKKAGSFLDDNGVVIGFANETSTASTSHSSTVFSSASSTAPTTSSAVSALPSLTSPPSKGLSTGAKVGLGVGIPLGVIALLAVGFLAMRYIRKARKSHDAGSAVNLMGVEAKPQELDATGPLELDTTAPNEFADPRVKQHFSRKHYQGASELFAG
ncbi:MAG: hypothetical protein M1820_007838 [Bogoriella megaspora]|nr:MAG: hypothetical protein M1820_007838 [Bogoriella megaspora]